MSPDQKKQALISLIDNMTACARDTSIQSYQMFLDYRKQIIDTLDDNAKENQKHLDLFQKLYRNYLEIDEKIFKGRSHMKSATQIE